MTSSLADLLGRSAPQLQTHPALLVLGLQEDFISPNGKLPVPTDSGWLERVKKVVPRFRDACGDVIWVRTIVDEEEKNDAGTDDSSSVIINMTEPTGPSARSDEESDSDSLAPQIINTSSTGKDELPKPSTQKVVLASEYEDIDTSKAPKASAEPQGPRDGELFLMRNAGRKPGCLRGTSGAGFAEAIRDFIIPKADIIVTKTRYSAFNGTSLLIMLRTKFITQLYICGCITNLSIYATALDAAQHGIQLNIVEDCLGYRDLGRHREALKQMEEAMGASMLTSTDILEDVNRPTDEELARERDTKEVEQLLIGMKVKGDAPAQPPEGEAFPSFDETRTAGEHEALRAAPQSSGVTSTVVNARQNRFRDRIELKSSGADDANKGPSNVMAMFRQRSKQREPVAEGSKGGSYVQSKPRMRNRRTKHKEGESSLSEYPSTLTASSSVETDTSEVKPEGLSLTRSTSNASFYSTVSGSSTAITIGDEEAAANKALELLMSLANDIGTHEKISQLVDMVNRYRSRIDSLKYLYSTVGTSVEDLNASLSGQSDIKPLPVIQKREVTAESQPYPPYAAGDTYLVKGLVPPSLTFCKTSISEQIFAWLYNEVHWQTMYHQTGAVPRLVCTQGAFGPGSGHPDGRKPVYRHPSDYTLPLMHFTPAVQMIKEEVIKKVGHPINHCLIQLYRGGVDYISEHSDKTLDIVRGSSIVNVSFGAQRTMRLRTKKSRMAASTADEERKNERETQRVPLPHNSMFVLGLESNMRWLHGIQPDKRRLEERADEENAFDGMRISLTFRYIGTFLSADETRIWGQGATSKDSPGNPVINNNEEASETVVRAFGTENHSTEFDWDKTYGRGFDVHHLRRDGKQQPIFFLGDVEEENQELKVIAKGFRLEDGSPDIVTPPPALKDTKEKRQVIFRDTDAKNTEVEGLKNIVLYMNRYRA